MANTSNTYTGDGATRTFAITWPFIANADVKVEVNSIDKVNPADWIFLSTTQIQFVVAPNQDDSVKIFRATKGDTRLVNYQDGTVLTEADLDLSANQNFFLVQEAKENFTDLINAELVRIGTANGIVSTDPQVIISSLVTTILNDAAISAMISAASGTPRTPQEIANGITPTDEGFLPGNWLRYNAKIDGISDDTQAINDSIQSGHPSFCDVSGTAKVDGTIVMDGDKTVTLFGALTCKRFSAATVPNLHVYGTRNVLNGNMITFRNDINQHAAGIILMGGDPSDTAGGTTDVDTVDNILRDFRIAGGMNNGVSQAGSPGLYFHSLKRKLGSFVGNTYYNDVYSGQYLNCDVSVEFSSNANANNIYGGFCQQFKKAAIITNGAYANRSYGLKIEKPLAVSPTRRYAIHLGEHDYGIETGTHATYSIDGALDNVFSGYAELPSSGSTVVSLFTHVTPSTGINFGRNTFDITGQLIAGVGTDGKSDDASIGPNEIKTELIYKDRKHTGAVQFWGTGFGQVDDKSGNTFGTDNYRVYDGTKRNLPESTVTGILEIDNVGPTDATLMIEVFYSSKEDSNSSAFGGRIMFLCQVEGSTPNAPVTVEDINSDGGETRSLNITCLQSAGTGTNTGKYTVSITTTAVAGTGDSFCNWVARLVSANLEGTNLDWDADVKYL